MKLFVPAETAVATASGRLIGIRQWWDGLVISGPRYGYFPNAVKTWLVVKPHLETEASTIFADTGISITTSGHRHLGAALGSRTFTEEFVSAKVQDWVVAIERLSVIAGTQPHAAYAAFTHGLQSRWVYLSRVAPDIADLLQPVENVLRQKFIPALTGRTQLGDVERELFPCLLASAAWE